MKAVLIVIGILFVIITGTAMYMKGVSLEQNCTGYLKQAADANSVETAREQLSKATGYLEENNLTSGYTSVFYKTPNEDISFWYKNLKQSEEELSTVDSTTSSLEKSNILLKLRETLMDNSGKEGDNVTVPPGLKYYPNNALWAVPRFLFWCLIVVLLAYAGVKSDS